MMDAASDAEVRAAMSQLDALESAILELAAEKEQVLAFLARKIAAVFVSAGGEAAAEGGADAMDVDPVPPRRRTRRLLTTLPLRRRRRTRR